MVPDSMLREWKPKENRASARSSVRFIGIIGHPVTMGCRSVGNVRFSISCAHRSPSEFFIQPTALFARVQLWRSRV